MNKRYLPRLLIALMLILSGCKAASGAAQANVPSPTGIASTNTPSPITPTPSPIPTATVSPVQTPQAVIVTAVKGNLFIRRGPDLAYNAVSVLMDGQSAKALARDILGTWLQITVPGHPTETGWVSIQSHYSVVNGTVMNLPEIIPADWPVQAWLQNCTYHQMQANPGGIIIPAVDNFPDNSVQVNPGVYTIHDTQVDGNPEVMEIEIKEGSEIDILDDGDGNHKKCPMP